MAVGTVVETGERIRAITFGDVASMALVRLPTATELAEFGRDAMVDLQRHDPTAAVTALLQCAQAGEDVFVCRDGRFVKVGMIDEVMVKSDMFDITTAFDTSRVMVPGPRHVRFSGRGVI